MFCKILLCFSVTLNFIHCNDIIVSVQNGKLKGKEKLTFKGKTFYSFQRIPYALPPIGNLRFKPPKPVESWNGILDVSLDSQTACPQLNFHKTYMNESEDCLYMNVYTPLKPNTTNGLPVLLYIHGGFFRRRAGNIDQYGPQHLLDNEDIVIVTFNYRLGLFGFLSTEDAVIPGNYGLKDQQLAIKWVHDNIAYFGGDPNKVVLFGLSAGGKSVTYQLLNKKNEGLFRGIISESGTFLSVTGLQRNARERAFKAGQTLDSNLKSSNDSNALYKVLMGASTEQLIKAGDESDTWFAPVIEHDSNEAFLTKKMYVSLLKGDLIKVPTLMGIATEERLMEAENYDQDIKNLVPLNMRITKPNEMMKLGREIRDIYTNGEKLASNLSVLVRYDSDNQYTRSSIKFAEVYSQYTDVYFYVFAYKGLLGDVKTHLDGCEKVQHAEDSNYIWSSNNVDFNNTDLNNFPIQDRIVAHREQSIINNFVKYLNPTPNKLENLIWPKFDSEHMMYVELNDVMSIKDHPKNQTYPKWIKIINTINFSDYDTY